MTNLTDIERQALQGILDSDFMDGAQGQDAIGKQVWTWSANPFPSKRTFAGAVSSLIQKGYAKSWDEGRDSTICITEAGLAALGGHRMIAVDWGKAI